MKQILIEKYIEPSEIEIISGDIIIQRWLDKYGDKHSFMGHPAVIAFTKVEIHYQYWYKKNLPHRDKHLPASIYYYKGKESSKFWWENGEQKFDKTTLGWD